MYRLPDGNAGTIALFINDPTPTLLSVELSYIEMRQVTGVVPSGNSRGKSATAIKAKEPKLDAKRIQVQNRMFTINLATSRIPSPLVKRLVYWLGIGNAKDNPYKSM
jgi:hypothetical protein